MKASIDGGVQDTTWVFAASRDPSIQTRAKKGEGGSFPAWQAGEFGIVGKEVGRETSK